MGLEKKINKVELKKHAATIHCSNTLSLLQRKISNALLYHAYKELMQKEEHEITVKQLCNLIGYNGNNHSVIKDSLKGLLSTVIEWNVVNDTTGQEDWTASSMLASVSLQGPVCLYAYSPRMKMLLHSPSMFGKINLFVQSRFKSSYGLALYENCIRYRGLSFTKWFSIDIFRKLMGVPAGKYTIFRDFKRRVLDKSVEEVNAYSDLIVEPELYRQGRQVVKIRFNLKERAKKMRLGKLIEHDQTTQMLTYQTNDANMMLSDQLITNYGMSLDQAQKIMGDYEHAFIGEKMKIVEASKNYQQGKVQNLAAYLLSALKNDYQAPKANAVRIKEDKSRDIHHAVEMKKLQTVIKKIRKGYLGYREQMIDQAVKRLNSAEYAYFMQDFRDYATDSIRTVLKLQRSKYTTETVIESPQIKALLRQFALHILPDLREDLLPFEKFIETLPEKNRSAWKRFKEENPDHELLRIADN